MISCVARIGPAVLPLDLTGREGPVPSRWARNGPLALSRGGGQVAVFVVVGVPTDGLADRSGSGAVGQVDHGTTVVPVIVGQPLPGRPAAQHGGAAPVRVQHAGRTATDTAGPAVPA